MAQKMTRKTCLLLLCLAATAWAQTPVGLVSSVTGTVKIVRAGKTEEAAVHAADLLGAGDRVLTGTDGEILFLYCPDPKSARVASRGEVFFGAQTLQVLKGKLEEERKISGCRLPSTLSLSAASRQQVGLARTRGGNVNLRSPSHTFIREAQPVFHWLAVDGAKNYEILVSDRAQRVLFKATITGTEVPYPADSPKLAAGQKYWWQVKARALEDALSEAGTFFQTLSEADARELKTAEAGLKKQMAAAPSDNGPLFLLAFLYEANGLLEDAVRTYDDLLQRSGSNEWLQSRKISLLNTLGWDKVERY